jgi:hypothetical protein
MLNWKSQKGELILKDYSVLFFSEEKLRKPTRNTSLWPNIQSQLRYFFPYAVQLDSSLRPSATLVVDFATNTGFALGMLDPPPTKPCGTLATRQVGPTAWHNAATKTLLLFGESSFGQALN